MKRAIAFTALALAAAGAWAGWPGNTTAKEQETDDSGWPVSSSSGNMGGLQLRCHAFGDFSYQGALTFGQRDSRIDQMIEEIVAATAGLSGDTRLIIMLTAANRGPYGGPS